MDMCLRFFQHPNFRSALSHRNQCESGGSRVQSVCVAKIWRLGPSGLPPPPDGQCAAPKKKNVVSEVTPLPVLLAKLTRGPGGKIRARQFVGPLPGAPLSQVLDLLAETRLRCKQGIMRAVNGAAWIGLKQHKDSGKSKNRRRNNHDNVAPHFPESWPIYLSRPKVVSTDLSYSNLL